MILLFIRSVLLSICLYSCDEPASAPRQPDDEIFTQYGVPYGAVPDPTDLVIYEVNIRAFSAGGDLQGVIDRLDNIKALGCNTIWLMPIYPVGQLKSAGGLGSPYAVQNYRAVNPEFGDLATLRALVQAAHDRHMAVILDWVANHTSWDNPWIANKAWYTQDGNGNIISPAGTNWQDVADLNYDNQDMRKAMIQAMKYWVMEANLDGFRCDAVDFVPTDFWKSAIDELKAIPRRKLIFLAEGAKAENFTAGFQLNYSWDFYNTISQVYKVSQPASTIFTTHQQEYQAIPAGGVKLRYTTNHDISAWEATPIEVFGNADAALSASVITIFTSAAPLLYSSQEVARAGKLSFFDKDPIDWTANSQVMASYEKLFAIYNQTPVFSKGSLTAFPHQDIAAFIRAKDASRYLVIVNVRNAPKTWTVDSTIKNTTWTNALDNTPYAVGTSINLPAYGYLILKK